MNRIVNGWLTTMPASQYGGLRIVPKFSIIIAYRNESSNIEACMRQLLNQKTTFPFEIIPVDDHSEDESRKIVESLQKESPLIKATYLSLNQGKKAAILLGIEKSTGDVIVTLDADIRVGDHWLEALGNHESNTESALTIMPVMLEGETTLFEKMQVVEFLSIMGTTGGSAMNQDAIMCNGANLAFSKKIFKEVNGFDGNQHLSSGDDMFLLIKLKKTNPKLISYLKNPAAIGWTKPTKDVKSFLNQRIRWASKATNLKDKSIMAAGTVVLLMNAIIVLHALFVALGLKSLLSFLLVLGIKSFFDWSLYTKVSPFFKKTQDLSVFAFTSLIFPFYCILVPIAGLVYKPSWKGRDIVQKNAAKRYNK